MQKKIIYKDDARKAFLQASRELAMPIRLTLGPNGRNVIINTINSMSYSTKDGVTVAGEIEHPDPFINACIKIIRQAARKTVEEAGDGTSSSSIMANAIIEELYKAILLGSSVYELKDKLKAELEEAVSIIKRNATPIMVDGEIDINKIKQIATISANNDEFIGGLFETAYKTIGSHGVILLNESSDSETSIEAVKGMKLDRGISNPNFANLQSGGCVFSDPLIFVTDKTITQQKEIIKIVDYAFTKQRPLVIFCSDINGEALGFINTNIKNNALKFAAVTFPNWLKFSKDILKDIAIYTNSAFCTEDDGYNIDNIGSAKLPTLLGTANKFQATAKDCLIIDGAGNQDEIQKRAEFISALRSKDLSDYDNEQILARKSRLLGGIAILRTGGQTEVERRETLARCEDAILAVRSAIEEGYLPGGGTMHSFISIILSKYHNSSILAKALLSIPQQILDNGNLSEDAKVGILNKLLDEDAIFEIGYNAKTDRMENLYESGVVDSAKVIKASLEAAVSIAIAFLNTDCIISEVVENKLSLLDKIKKIWK
jgi:chaperonin GroEL